MSTIKIDLRAGIDAANHHELFDAALRIVERLDDIEVDLVVRANEASPLAQVEVTSPYWLGKLYRHFLDTESHPINIEDVVQGILASSAKNFDATLLELLAIGEKHLGLDPSVIERYKEAHKRQTNPDA
jgi:hypothetical protein